MTTLNPCIYCGSPAVEQIRGEYHRRNRNDVPENDIPGALLVEMRPEIADDFRVACMKHSDHDWRRPYAVPQCDNATGWSLPTLKEAEKCRKRWNAANPSSVDQYGS
jgi:hypothetical protein